MKIECANVRCKRGKGGTRKVFVWKPAPVSKERSGAGGQRMPEYCEDACKQQAFYYRSKRVGGVTYRQKYRRKARKLEAQRGAGRRKS